MFSAESAGRVSTETATTSVELLGQAADREQRARERNRRMIIKIRDDVEEDEIVFAVREQLRRLSSLQAARQGCAELLDGATTLRLRSLILQLQEGEIQEAADNLETIIRNDHSKGRVQIRQSGRQRSVSIARGAASAVTYRNLARKVDRLLELGRDSRSKRQMVVQFGKLQIQLKRAEQRLTNDASGNEQGARELAHVVERVIYPVQYPRLWRARKRVSQIGKTIAKGIPPVIAGVLAEDLWDAGKERRTRSKGGPSETQGHQFRSSKRVGPVPRPTPRSSNAAAIANDETRDLVSRANRLKESSNYFEAEQLYKRAIAGGNRKVFHALGEVLERQAGRKKEAEWAFREAVRNGNTHAYLGLWRTLRNLRGREREIVEVAQTAERVFRAEIGQGRSSAQASLCYILSVQPGRESDAEKECQTAISLGQQWPCRYLGDMLAELPGRERDAERAYRGYIPGPIPMHAALIRLLSRQPGRREEALRMYQELIRAHGKDGLAGYELEELFDR